MSTVLPDGPTHLTWARPPLRTARVAFAPSKTDFLFRKRSPSSQRPFHPRYTHPGTDGRTDRTGQGFATLSSEGKMLLLCWHISFILVISASSIYLKVHIPLDRNYRSFKNLWQTFLRGKFPNCTFTHLAKLSSRCGTPPPPHIQHENV